MLLGRVGQVCEPVPEVGIGRGDPFGGELSDESFHLDPVTRFAGAWARDSAFHFCVPKVPVQGRPLKGRTLVRRDSMSGPGWSEGWSALIPYRDAQVVRWSGPKLTFWRSVVRSEVWSAIIRDAPDATATHR